MTKQINENDLLAAIVNQKPLEIKAVFESIMTEKVSAIVAEKKAELSKTVFSAKNEG
jgi:hypothetical protein